jgi:hypothetical protein
VIAAFAFPAPLGIALRLVQARLRERPSSPRLARGKPGAVAGEKH